MAQQLINIGTTPNDGTGTPLRDAGTIINENFTELYGQTGHASYSDLGYTELAPFVLAADTDTVLPNRATTIYDDELPLGVKCFYFGKQLDVSPVSGTLIEGETITGGTSGATGLLIQKDNDNLKLLNVVGVFTTETVTGGTSGATATVTTVGNGGVTGRNGDNLDVMIYFKAKSSVVSQWLDIWIDIGGAVGELYRLTESFPKGSGVARGILYPLPSAYTRGTFEANNGTVYVRSNGSVEIYSINFNFDRNHKGRAI